jgi:protein-tyrosine-phosphatase
LKGRPGRADRVRARVLFLCTGNSGRSQIAEALLGQLSGGGVEVASAGSRPKPLHPEAVRVMREHGIDISGRRSKHLEEFSGQRFGYVVTLCDRVREVCPDFPGHPADPLEHRRPGRRGGRARRVPPGGGRAADPDRLPARPHRGVAVEHRAGLDTVVREWGRIGCVGFGGPPAHIALLRQLCVERRQWLDAQEFEDAIAACNLLPGPASTELAIFCAWRVRGQVGALAGGAAAATIGPWLVLVLLGSGLAELALRRPRGGIPGQQGPGAAAGTVRGWRCCPRSARRRRAAGCWPGWPGWRSRWERCRSAAAS